MPHRPLVRGLGLQVGVAAVQVVDLQVVLARHRVVELRRGLQHLRVVQVAQRRCAEARAIGAAHQQVLHRLPAQVALPVGGVAEVAVVVPAQRQVAVQVLDDRDVEFAEQCVHRAVGVKRLGRAAEAGDVAAELRRRGRLHQALGAVLVACGIHHHAGGQLGHVTGQRGLGSEGLCLAAERVTDVLRRRDGLLEGCRLVQRPGVPIAGRVLRGLGKTDLREVAVGDRALQLVLVPGHRHIVGLLQPFAAHAADDTGLRTGVLAGTRAEVEYARSDAQRLPHQRARAGCIEKIGGRLIGRIGRADQQHPVDALVVEFLVGRHEAGTQRAGLIGHGGHGARPQGVGVDLSALVEAEREVPGERCVLGCADQADERTRYRSCSTARRWCWATATRPC